MKFAAAILATAAAYDAEWAEFQAAQGARNGDIPEAFKANVDFVKKFNAEHDNVKVSYTGPFAAMNKAEFKELLGYKAGSLMGELPKVGKHEMSGLQAPESIDWTEKDAVTKPKNQGQTSACWSFSATGGLEGAWAIASGKLVSLSEQQLIDCSNAGTAAGGGLPSMAFNWFAMTGSASATEESYPFTGHDDQCKTEWEEGVPKGGVTGYMPVQGEDAMLDALATAGPLSAGIEADEQAFQLYHSGVLTGECGSQLDHGITVVGYGNMDGTDYWKIKNSWGESWGMGGYINIERGVGKCGIGMDAGYPAVSASVQV